MLQARNICTFYGKIQALWDVSFEINEGEIVVLVGSNGAGKTTLLNTLSGIVRPASGRVEFAGKRIDGQPVAHILEQGLSHVPQGGRLFPDMPVRENLEMGAYLSHAWKQREETMKYVYQIFPLLKEREKQIVIQSLEMADRAYVLENGRVVLEGKSRDLLQNDYVRIAYLGL